MFLLGIHSLSAQEKHDYHWFLGGLNYSWPDSLWWSTHLDFQQSPPQINLVETKHRVNSQAGTISDFYGNLLFYSNGCFIRNKDYTLMVNSDTLVPVYSYFNNCSTSSLAPRDGMIIFKDNYRISKYWCINQGVDLIKYPGGGFNLFIKLYYAIVDMNENGGLGSVISKGNFVEPDSLYAGIHAIPHQNGKDWWVMLGDEYTNTFYPMLIDSMGPRVTDTIFLAGAPPKNAGAGGQVVFSPIGDRFLQFTPDQGTYWMDFDRSTGAVSNLQHYQWETTDLFGGASISPSGQYAYFNDYTSVWQMDLWDADPPSTFTLIGEWDGYVDENNSPVGFSKQRLGPDCRIYIGPSDFTRYIHIIEYPNRPYPDCSFQQRYIHTPTYITEGMPNFPLFRVGSQWPVCDSTLAIPTAVHEPDHHSSDLTLWPNPCTTALTVDLGHLPGPDVWMQVYDLQGRMLEKHPASGVQEVLFTAHWSPGMYVVRLIDEQGRSKVGKVVKD